jgi:hypothetical protein
MEGMTERRYGIALEELRVGDSVLFRHSNRNLYETKVLGLVRGPNGAVTGFYPEASLGVDSKVAIGIERVLTATRAALPNHKP